MINRFAFKTAVSSIEDSIFVLDNKFNDLETSLSRAGVNPSDVNKKNYCQTVIESSSQANLQFSDSQQAAADCRTPDINAIKFGTVWTREAMWPI